MYRYAHVFASSVRTARRPKLYHETVMKTSQVSMRKDASSMGIEEHAKETVQAKQLPENQLPENEQILNGLIVLLLVGDSNGKT